MDTVTVTMIIGYEVAGSRWQLTKRGFGHSKKAAKKDGYRRAMSEIKRLTHPDRYTVIYSFPKDDCEEARFERTAD